MTTRRSPLSFTIFLGLLAVALGTVLVVSLFKGGGFDSRVPAWLFLIGLFALLELADLLFHHGDEREGISSSEAILLPLLVGFTFSQAVWGVAVAITIATLLDRRVGGVKAVFNVLDLGVAAAVAAGIWALLKEDVAGLSPRNAATAVLAVLLFTLLTHFFVSLAISLSQRKPLRAVGAPIRSALGWNLAGNVSLGVFLAAAFLQDAWTVILFPAPLAFLYFGYRAVVRQISERERVENLHSASRALAASASLEQALVEFLKAVAEVASAAEARVIVDTHKQRIWTGVRGDEVIANGSQLEKGPMHDLLVEVERAMQPVIINRDDSPASKRLCLDIGARIMLAVPLLDSDAVVGCLVVIDRLGADEFGSSEMRLLEALGHELVLTLDSYRLFTEISEERERFRRIFTASQEGICLLDDRGVVRAWNPALARISGYESPEVTGRLWSERIVVRTKDHDRIEGMDLVHLPSDEEFELVSREGPSRWIAVLSSPVRSADETGWVVLVRDVTAEHLVEEAKSDFLSTISHELRTPLTTIKGSLQILGKGTGKLDEQARDRLIGVMEKGSERLERLVLNLLFVSQVEADGAPRVTIEEFDLVDAVRRRVALIAGDRPVDMRFETEPIAVRADRERVEHVVEHLVENALKFGPHGPVTVEVDRAEGFARLSVTDEGPGIPTVDQERIFERFVRLGDVLTRQTQGPGVGLFIVKRSVEALGGKVYVDSEPGKGATFQVTFPLAKPMVVADDATSA